MPRYAMLIDLDRCMGCHSCTIACRQENATPPGIRWTSVHQIDRGDYPAVRRLFVPRGCMHCDEPPCVPVCPTGASYRRHDGIVLVEHSRCIGCKACMVACPYEARHYVERPGPYYADAATPYEMARRAGEHPEGTVTKCTFCVHRVDRGLQPACIDTCPAHARYFGDLDDPASEIHRLAQDPRASLPSPEWGTKPSVVYLMPYVRHAPDTVDMAAAQGERAAG
jgi:molybdopterin-containing oxidoreductase family iron-sulfur binding subunit